MGPTWGPSGADRTQVGPMLVPWTLLSGLFCNTQYHRDSIVNNVLLHWNPWLFRPNRILFVLWCFGWIYMAEIRFSPIPAKTLIWYKHPSRLLGSLGGSNQPWQPRRLDYICTAHSSDHLCRKGRQSLQRHQCPQNMQKICMSLDHWQLYSLYLGTPKTASHYQQTAYRRGRGLKTEIDSELICEYVWYLDRSI